MLNIQKTIENDKAVLTLNGRLDTNTAPELEKELRAAFPGLTELTLDFAGLEYISSAGLRVLLEAHMNMTLNGGQMRVIHVDRAIMDVFDITGFSGVLTIE